MRSEICIHVLAFFVLVTSNSAPGDVITTHDGNRITGIVTDRSESTVTIDVGLGSISLNASQVDVIQVFESGRNDSLRNHWMREFFATDQYVPRGFESLAREFRELEAKRSSATVARQTIQSLSDNRRELQERLHEEEEDLIEAYRRIRRLSASLIGSEYNRRVMDINRCRSSVALTQTEIGGIDYEIEESYHTIAAYLQSLRTMERNLEDTLRVYRERGISQEAGRFLDILGTRLTEMSAEFHSMSIPYHGLSDGRIVVTAIVNNERAGKFLVDTGASAVALSRRFYETLTDTLNRSRHVTIALADGSEMAARQITLQSLQVGNAHLENVDAVVLNQGPSMGNDGVLGMSFLGNYGIIIDSVQGKLVLEEYTPDGAEPDAGDSLHLTIQPMFD